jgi:hypothetical protein
LVQGLVLPFEHSYEIVVRFVGMADNADLQPVERVKELGRQGLLWITTFTAESAKDKQCFEQFARSLSNAELSASLEFNASYNRSATAKAVMHEAARRLRGEPQMVPAENPPKPPTLKAYAIPEVT